MDFFKKTPHSKLSHTQTRFLALMCGGMALLILAALVVGGGVRTLSPFAEGVSSGSQTASILSCWLYGCGGQPSAPGIYSFGGPDVYYGQSGTLSWSTGFKYKMDSVDQESYNCTLTGGQFTQVVSSSDRNYAAGTSVSYSGSVDIGPVYGQSPTYYLKCTEYYGNGSPSNAASTVIYSVNPPAPSISIWASPNPTSYNGASTISWSATGGQGYDACYFGGGQWGGGVGVGTSGSTGTNGLTSATQYWISCHDTYYQWQTAYVTVGVNPPPTPTASISTSPTNIYAGQASIISWSSSNASSCSVSGPGVSSGATSGSVSTGALSAGTKTYSISCSGAGGSASNSATVNVGAIPANCSSGTCSISTNPSTILLGKSVTVSWSCSSSIYSSSNGDASYSTGGALSGNKTLTPITATCYNLTCTASAGSTNGSSCVNVLAPIITFSTSPLRVRKNVPTPVTFTWKVVNAPAACTITGPSGFTPITVTPVEAVTNSQTSTLTLSQQSIFTFTCTGIGVQQTIKLIPITQEL